LGVELFVFVFGRIVGVTILIRPNSSKPVFGTALLFTVTSNASNALLFLLLGNDLSLEIAGFSDF